MNDRIERKKRRSRQWRQRAGRVRYNELHQEWSRRNRFWWNTHHYQSLAYPSYPPCRNDVWWDSAMRCTDPQSRNALCQPRRNQPMPFNQPSSPELRAIARRLLDKQIVALH